ncbi:Oidioi.mRNA.OKI2018_I69.chr1.g1631.t1.cds [Oikopleura dioica]|uniref:Oidioi.mRNA.OKI2018_I69.chr1.g1631.t1.cds n=1 Tax=Oikopleura dioica TaxID=34765 RepID=A0ABN7SP07_OIKDI|nr:Oidioi.mRNA.OKI2018_I69.chr1.g1631.t1.cds [Oikopleura dioica]
MSATETRANFEIETSEVPTDDNEHENLPDISEVIEFFGLDEAALRAGQEACLDRHNEKRALHQSTKDMKLDKNLTDDAQKWAEKIARGDATGYDPDTICGENISIIPFESELPYLTQGDYVGVARFAVDTWYNQVSNYDFPQHTKKNPNGITVSSFVQTIWKISTYLGVGIALKPDGSEVVVVCRYLQKGNIEGNRPQQVGQLKQ